MEYCPNSLSVIHRYPPAQFASRSSGVDIGTAGRSPPVANGSSVEEHPIMKSDIALTAITARTIVWIDTFTPKVMAEPGASGLGSSPNAWCIEVIAA